MPSEKEGWSKPAENEKGTEVSDLKQAPTGPGTLSWGQKAAGVSFNPSKDRDVDDVKAIFAEAIDKINDLRKLCAPGEKARYFSKAISHAEDAQMNAVKAITWQY